MSLTTTKLLSRFPKCPNPKFPLFYRKVANLDEMFLFSMCLEVEESEKNRFLGQCDATGGAFKGLKQALATCTAKIPGFEFLNVILPGIQNAVARLPASFGESCEIPILGQHQTGVVKLLRSQIFILNAAAFLGLVGMPENERCGDMHWMNVLMQNSIVGAARVSCQLAYFHQVIVLLGGLDALIEEERKHPEVHTVVFERVSRLGEGAFPNYGMSDEPLLDEYNPITIDAKLRIEEFPSADAHVDFANKQIHIGRIIASATQEEVLFSIRPELFPCLIIFEQLLDHEAVLVHGARKYCDYFGYQHSFRFQNVSPMDTLSFENIAEKQAPVMIVIDAIVNNGQEFTRDACDRDLNKAFAGFAFYKIEQKEHLPELVDGCEAVVMWPSIATGGWGCGVFGGDQLLKFAQQLMASRLAKTRLLYSTFGNADRAKLFQGVAFRLKTHRVTVRQMREWIDQFGVFRQKSDEDFIDDFETFILQRLV